MVNYFGVPYNYSDRATLELDWNGIKQKIAQLLVPLRQVCPTPYNFPLLLPSLSLSLCTNCIHPPGRQIMRSLVVSGPPLGEPIGIPQTMQQNS